MLRNVVALLIVTAFADSVVEPRQDWVMIPCSRKFQRSSIGLVKETEENDNSGCLLTERFQCFLLSSSINPKLVYTNLHSWGAFVKGPDLLPDVLPILLQIQGQCFNFRLTSAKESCRKAKALSPNCKTESIVDAIKVSKFHDQGSASCKQVMHKAESPCASSLLSLKKKTAHCSTIYSRREEESEFND